MNLYEFEGKNLLEKYGIKIPKGTIVRRGDNIAEAYSSLGIADVVVKAQVLSGKRGKNKGIEFCSNVSEVEKACARIFASEILGQYVAALRIEQKLDIAVEHYLSITYDTKAKQPVLVYSEAGGVDIEDVLEQKIQKHLLNVRQNEIGLKLPYAANLWKCFLEQDARLVEINPLVKTQDGEWVAADAKVALDDDAFFRHEEWNTLEPRTMLGRLPTNRELAVKKIDEGESYYRGTAGKYIELDGDIAVLFSGGGASIANMDALIQAGLKPANYTEYSGNPPREKVYGLAKIVLSKPGLKGLWIAGGVANFTDVKETFLGIIDAMDELKPAFPIVVRRAGPNEKQAMELLKDCARRNNLNIQIFGKEMPMTKTANILAEMIKIGSK
jgi:succinyl-CoA synthetase beta subunit